MMIKGGNMAESNSHHTHRIIIMSTITWRRVRLGKSNPVRVGLLEFQIQVKYSNFQPVHITWVCFIIIRLFGEVI